MIRIISITSALIILNACSFQQQNESEMPVKEKAEAVVESVSEPVERLQEADSAKQAIQTEKQQAAEEVQSVEAVVSTAVKEAKDEAQSEGEARKEDVKSKAEEQQAALLALQQEEEQKQKLAAAKLEQERIEQEAQEKAAELERRAAAEKAAKERAEREEAARLKAERERAAAEASAARKAAASSGYSIPNFQGVELGGTVLTAVGAERKGNASGTIPDWSGKMRQAPNGAFSSGNVYPDPYAKDAVSFTIKASNVDRYADQLSEGLQTLFKKYPDTFYMNIYPTHRDGRYSDLVESRTKWNAQHTKLVNGVDGLNNYTGGVPFPKPKNANEVLWNGRVIHPHPTVNGVMDDIAVYLNGNKQQRRQTFVSEFPFSYKDNPVGKTDEDIGVNAAYVHVTIDRPERQKGQMTIVHEALDQVKNERMAWVYIPGSRRVRRTPTVGYDTPDGPGGLVTVDDSLGFNGAMDRYDWKLLGKKEMYIPYHSYKFDTPSVKYDTLLMKGHANPEYMRYELHRVWVVEANLKRGARHVYLKRRFYIDEDSWHIVLVESFDGRGDLWRVGILNTVYDFAVQGFVARAQVFHDMQSGGYIAMRLVNETAPMRMTDTPKGENYYSPANLRRLGM